MNCVRMFDASRSISARTTYLIEARSSSYEISYNVAALGLVMSCYCWYLWVLTAFVSLISRIVNPWRRNVQQKMLTSANG